MRDKPVSRRSVLKAGASAIALPFFGLSLLESDAHAASGTGKVSVVNGIATGADVAEAEREGALTIYTHDNIAGMSGICADFQKLFPKIDTKYVSLQTGNLYTRLLAERQASRYLADIVQFSDIGVAMDFQKRGGYEEYHSPQDKNYKPQYLSDPAGYYFWIGVSVAGIAYNSKLVSADEAPRDWPDLINPKWKDRISFKLTSSGDQFLEWYMLRQLYGDKFWQSISELKIKGFNSFVQLFDRLSRGDDLICGIADWQGYEPYHLKNAPVNFVIPKSGVTAIQFLNGIASKAPHPQAARLFSDWVRSDVGQASYQTNPHMFYLSVRNNMKRPAGAPNLDEIPVLVPKDVQKFVASRSTYNKEWNAMLGLI
ncbi:extracellular solute-binding protein [Candidimonas humi]|uniref:ABC transporter substrate-binding protein n=1 Tax=Candidimonas humi TaxID=683355 RepID=A0ABV8NWB7_9BURK|nr:extracellular solute-binding protein [Candidimonas humi]MBV6303350.1 extracellular solute-binding protein [Candidimonas humi]